VRGRARPTAVVPRRTDLAPVVVNTANARKVRVVR
jgi:hypothetical protein